MDAAAKTVRKQRGKPFPKGQSGNPAGRPQGSRNKVTLAALSLLEGEAEKITRKAVKMALKGNPIALRICIERLVPPCRERSLRVKMPALKSTEDLPKLTAAILRAVGKSEITPSEATALSTLIMAHARGVEITEFEKRLAAIEKSLEKKGAVPHGV